ncbi:MAG TPA: DUF418 domain-containing protein [Tepidisphaeraceae bacterium]|nr:DUF418 domain-containing protein [Tepidisphaeraceae bacterium]
MTLDYKSIPPEIPIGRPSSDRVWMIDAIRGFALLGILLLNIQSFAMPLEAYFNAQAWLPTERGMLVAHVMDVVGEGRFMSIFSILFGVGIVMQGERQHERATSIHIRRMLWLLAIGLIHAYIFWYGDILTCYALAGLAIFWLRKYSAKTLLWIALGLIGFGILFQLAMFAAMMFTPPDQQFNPFVLGEGTAEERRVAEVTAMRGSWLDQMSYRGPYALMIQIFMIFAMPGLAGLMLLGMSLFKFGWFDFDRCRRARALMMVIGIGLGWTLGAAGMWLSRPGGPFEKPAAQGSDPLAAFAIPLTAIGYISALMFVCQLLGARLLHPLACVGRTALSCYLTHTLICTTIFYGHGFGLFGNYDRFQLLGFVVGIWIAQLIIAPLWLSAFRFGPMEWLWRSLTYARLQPLTK